MPREELCVDWDQGRVFCLLFPFDRFNFFKAVLSVLIRNFSFDLPGPDTDIGVFRSIGIRPMVVGEDGPKVPLVIRKVRTE